jgi:hypothetical protein
VERRKDLVERDLVTTMGLPFDEQLSAMRRHPEPAELQDRERIMLGVHAEDCTGLLQQLPE